MQGFDKIPPVFLEEPGRDNAKNQRWLSAVIFVYGRNHFRADTTRTLEEHLRQIHCIKIRPVVSEEIR